MAELTREQVVEMGRDALAAAAVAETSGLPEEVNRAAIYKQFATMCAQLVGAMDALQNLKAVQVWLMAEAHLKREKGQAGLLVVVVPRRGVAGAGIATFSLIEVANLRLPESRRAHFGELAAATYETAVAQAQAAPQNPNGEEV